MSSEFFSENFSSYFRIIFLDVCSPKDHIRTQLRRIVKFYHVSLLITELKKNLKFNEIFLVTSDVMFALISLLTEFGGHIEDNEMKLDKNHFGQMAGLNDNHVKPDTAH